MKQALVGIWWREFDKGCEFGIGIGNNSTTMIVVGKIFGNVGFWDVDSEDDDRLYLYHPHAGTISGISMHQHYFEKVINLVSKIGCIVLTCFAIVGMSNSSKNYEPHAHLFAFGT